ncbi:AI-2E family transporter [Rhizobium sp. KVB221]|uniref:AI-2E family transporter n=1 Tax=Rhizobium setariae TaxID=2801340 RepID=A0A937CL92_9HYPH|nr:AI-2E family transporter [Rhizobium setariae]MBL0372935.1 AI-2E family transporter [Rhizobium setariae]
MDPKVSDPVFAPSRPPVLHAALQIALVALLVYACSRIALPFIGILLWSVILAAMLYPLHLHLRARVGNRWSATIIGLVGVAVMLVPMLMVVTSLGSSIYALVSGLQNHSLTIPAPPPRLADLPVIGKKLADGWSLVATNMPMALAKYGPMLSKSAAWLASFAGGLATGGLSFVLSIGIAALIVAYAEGATGFVRRLMSTITNDEARGARLVKLTAATIRGVALGVVGVALIQTLLIGIGFFAIGIPAAGALTLITFLVAVVQIPALLVTIPIIGYVLATEATTPAMVFTVWTVVAGLSDNVLKPIMLGRGLDVPMPVILIGVIGGMIADGLLGLFIGPVLLAVGYVLLIEWLYPSTDDTHLHIGEPAP